MSGLSNLDSFRERTKPDTQDTAGEAGTSSSVIYSYGPPYMAEQKQDDQLEHTYSNYVRIRDVTLKTCQRRWTIRKSDERGSGISVLAARHDDDDDDDFVGFGWVLWHINHRIVFSAKPCSYIYIKYIRFALVEFYGISTIVGCLLLNSVYTYMFDIYHL